MSKVLGQCLTSNIACLMSRHTLKDFRIDCLQPAWLPTRTARAIYFVLTRAFDSLAIPIVLVWVIHPGAYPRLTLFFICSNILSSVPAAIVAFVATDRALSGVEYGIWTARSIYFAFMTVWFVIQLAITGWFLDPRILNEPGLATLAAISCSLCAMWVWPTPEWKPDCADIHPVFWVRWDLRRAIILGTGFGCATGFFVWEFMRQLDEALVSLFRLLGVNAVPESNLPYLVQGVLLGFVLGFVFGGIRPGIAVGNTNPNGAIVRSAIFAICSFAGVFLFGIVVALLTSDISQIAPAACALGLLVGYIFGGRAVLRHYFARSLFAIRGILPLRLRWFMDRGCADGFFRSAGGRYLFDNREVQSCFETRSAELIDRLQHLR